MIRGDRTTKQRDSRAVIIPLNGGVIMISCTAEKADEIERNLKNEAAFSGKEE